MSKIVRAINAMVTNQRFIGNAIEGVYDNNELFFEYNKKYKWSIIEYDNGDEYSLTYYQENNTIESLIKMSPDESNKIKQAISYSTKDINTQEAYASFRELYLVIKEKITGMNAILDEIISDNEY